MAAVKLSDLEPGGWFTVKRAVGNYADFQIGCLLSVDRWVHGWEGPRPHDPDRDRPPGRSDRHVPMAMLEPVVFLADGRPHVTTWGYDLHVGQSRTCGSRTGRVPVESMHVRVKPSLVPVKLIVGRWR